MTDWCCFLFRSFARVHTSPSAGEGAARELSASPPRALLPRCLRWSLSRARSQLASLVSVGSDRRPHDRRRSTHPTPTEMDQYDIGGVVGKGSFGVVVLVTRRCDGAQFVMKRLPIQNASLAEMDAYQNEIRLLSELVRTPREKQDRAKMPPTHWSCCSSHSPRVRISLSFHRVCVVPRPPRTRRSIRASWATSSHSSIARRWTSASSWLGAPAAT